jgi:hypothetical protein
MAAQRRASAEGQQMWLTKGGGYMGSRAQARSELNSCLFEGQRRRGHRRTQEKERPTDDGNAEWQLRGVSVSPHFVTSEDS